MSNKETTDDKTLRTFETGATRDTAHNKLDFEAILSPAVLLRYVQYMDKNKLQSDGSIREGDNWQKGIPKDTYMKSGHRHFMDWWLIHRKLPNLAVNKDIEEVLCALIFNASGYLFEILKDRDDG